MEMVGTIHAKGELNSQDWGVMSLPQVLIVHEREKGVVGLNGGVGRERVEDWCEVKRREGGKAEIDGEHTADVDKRARERTRLEEISGEVESLRQEKSEAEVCRDLLRELEASSMSAKQEKSEAEACRDLL